MAEIPPKGLFPCAPGLRTCDTQRIMTLDLPATLAILAATAALFAYASWRASQPPHPLKVRMINYHVVQLFAVVAALVMLAHVITLMGGSTQAQVPR